MDVCPLCVAEGTWKLQHYNKIQFFFEIIIIISLYLVILSLPFTYGGTILSKEILICWENMSRQLQHIS